MIQRITVLDESGNVIGDTYPKRAKGLVKKGRALYVDETTICLTEAEERSGDVPAESGN